MSVSTLRLFARLLLLLAPCLGLASQLAEAQSAWVRVNQAGYEEGHPLRAYLMATAPITGATFRVVDEAGSTRYAAKVGTLLGSWSNSPTLTYQVYALDFSVPCGKIYSISVSGPVRAHSPHFAVDHPDVLYSGLLLNTLFFYETERDGPNYIRNALRSAPGHVKDEDAKRYLPPPLDGDDYINNPPPTPPLVPSRLKNIDASGGWWDAGDYTKYVANITYVTALMEIGVRDFPKQMGADAHFYPPAPPVSASYAGTSGTGAPLSSDFTAEAKFGMDWLSKMWDSTTHTLSYQVDNTQEWNYYGYGNPTSTNPNCGGTYNSPYCLITEYDIWTLPQAADRYQQPGDPEPCDKLTTYYICNRPVFSALPSGSRISPNLAGRLSADFALCYQLNYASRPALANRCLRNAETIFAMADLSFTDPAPAPGDGSCANCLLTSTPPSAETVWDDDMELGATELYFALHAATEAHALPDGLPENKPLVYLQKAARFAKNYATNVYAQGSGDTLNVYDVSGLAHFELYRAIALEGDPQGLALSQAALRNQFLLQVNAAIAQAKLDPWEFGEEWDNGDVTSHGAGLSVMASEAFALTGAPRYNGYAQKWLGNILGANAWAHRLSWATARRSLTAFNIRSPISQAPSMAPPAAHRSFGEHLPRGRRTIPAPVPSTE